MLRESYIYMCEEVHMRGLLAVGAFPRRGVFNRKNMVSTEGAGESRKMMTEANGKNMSGEDTVSVQHGSPNRHGHDSSTHKLSSGKFKETSDTSTIPDFVVATVFDVGEEFGTMLQNILTYYDYVNENFHGRRDRC